MRTFTANFTIQFDGETDAGRRKLLLLLHALCAENQAFLRDNDAPLLYESGVVYAPEDGRELWFDIPNAIAARAVDCEDLACWRVSELREAGIKARPFIKWDDVRLFHVLVLREPGGIVAANGVAALPPQCPIGATWQRLPNGAIVEDPSLALGMGWR